MSVGVFTIFKTLPQNIQLINVITIAITIAMRIALLTYDRIFL